jgi:hypothetical protein
MATYDSRFAQVLAALLAEDLTAAHNALGSGSLIQREDAAATGMSCAGYMGEIRGLRRALQRIAHAQEELSGKSKPPSRTGPSSHERDQD